MAIHIDKKNKTIHVTLVPPKHYTNVDTTALAINGTSILGVVFGGLSNIATATAGTTTYALTQLFFGLSNQKLRSKIIDLEDKYMNLKNFFRNEGYYIAPLARPTGFSNFGLHNNLASTSISVAATIINLLLQVAATYTTISENIATNRVLKQLCDNEVSLFQNATKIHEVCTQLQPSLFEFCTTAYCIASYTLLSTAVITSTLEQHFKRVNLEQWVDTLEEAVKALNELKIEVDTKARIRHQLGLR